MYIHLRQYIMIHFIRSLSSLTKTVRKWENIDELNFGDDREQ